MDLPLKAGVNLRLSVECLLDPNLDRGTSKTRSLIQMSFQVLDFELGH